MVDAFLDADQIRATTFVRHVEIHDTLGSTNDRAADLARDPDIELPALVVARRQTAGRGRGKNQWWSADGALTFSILLEPSTMRIRAANWPQLSLTTAVAICDALQREAPDANFAIKWPNDVMLDGGKVGGILIESPAGTSPAKDRVVIGVGINLNNSWRTAPRHVGPSGAALIDSTGRQHSFRSVLVGMLQSIDTRTAQLAAHDPQLPLAWQRLCWLTERGVEVHADGRSIEGVCVGIDGDGALQVADAFGIHPIYSGTVRLR
jgi:BirA family biotin operon repressor/biotin-[acetyl-CoA-carboxylase] ligase